MGKRVGRGDEAAQSRPITGFQHPCRTDDLVERHSEIVEFLDSDRGTLLGENRGNSFV